MDQVVLRDPTKRIRNIALAILRPGAFAPRFPINRLCVQASEHVGSVRRQQGRALYLRDH